MPELPVGLRRYLDISRQPAGSAFHTSQVSISFGEAIDAEALRAGWEAVARAHAALRTTFDDAGATLENPEPAFDWQTLDWQSDPPEDLGSAWQTLVQTDAASPIASGGAAPARITLIRLPNGQGHALWSFHAALIDDSSVSLALHEWLTAYDCRRMGEDLPAFADDSGEAHESFDAWKEAFEGFSPPRPLIVLPLPDMELAGAGLRRSLAHIFERPERADFFAAAATAKADFRSLCGAAWAFVVARATAADDTLLLEPSRSAGGIGRREIFVPRRRAVEKFATSGELIRAFAESAPDAPADLSTFASALGLSVAEAEPATAFIYRDLRLNDRLLLAMPRWMAADSQLFQKTAPAITLRVTATDRPEIALDYDPSRLSDSAAQLLFEAFRGTLAAFAANADLVLAEFALPLPTALIQGPDAPPTFRSLVPQGLHEIFADVAGESPEAIAVEMAGEKMTFAQLNSAANQLARYLQKRGVTAGSRVGVAMTRSPRWVVALLGTLKAGATIVPLAADASTAAAGIKAWIVDQLAEGETRDLPVVQMQAEAGSIGNEKSRGIAGESAPSAEALAWLEGDSVRAIDHDTLATGLQSTTALFGVAPSDRVLQFSPPGSFSAIEETFLTLLSGASLILREDNRWPTRTAIQEFVQESGVTLVNVPTPFWAQWTQYLGELSIPAPASLRLVALSGDRPTANAAATWVAAAPSTRLIHRTAALELGSLGLADESGSPEIFAPAALGVPTPATRARLVDRRGLALPFGLPGALEIAPAGRENFIPLGCEAFSAPDGRIFERPALERALVPSLHLTAESIRLAAVTHPDVIDAYADQRLIAARPEWCLWVLPRDSQRGEPHDFREWLTAHLPAAPRRIRALPRFPLDDAGGIDVPALTELLPEDAAAPTVRKGSEIEERLRQAISRALGGRRIDFDEIITDGRTRSETAKLLYEAVARELPDVEPAEFTTGFSVRSLLRNVRGRQSRTHGKWTPIQPLRASGKQPPLIFVHDFDGSAKPFAPLIAHLDADQPGYAITARGFTDPGACHATIAEMAAAYVEALRTFDANGPYRLVGYGFGGIVAFEMTRQLSTENVSLLVTLATEPPVAASPAGFLAGGWKRALPALFGRKSDDETRIRRRRSSDSPVFRANQEAARKYSATTSPVTIHVFSPERNFPSHRAVQAGWNACCGDARFYQVPCSGSEMMDEPVVEAVANAITKLARAEVLDEELETDE